MKDFARFGEEFQKFGQNGFDAAVHSYGEWNKALQALATRFTENTKKAFEDTTRTWEQLVGAKSIEQVIEIQSQYAKRTYDNFVAEASKLGEWYVSFVQDASKSFEKPFEAVAKKKAA
jgi:phasin family protein